MIRVLLMVRSLTDAGAENVATTLACSLDRKAFMPRMLSLRSALGSHLETTLAHNLVDVQYLGKKGGFDRKTVGRIAHVVEEFRPHIIHTHSTILPYVLAATWRRRVPVVLHTVHSVADKETQGIGRLLQAFAFRRGVVPVAIANAVAHSLNCVYGIENAPVIHNGIPVETIASFTGARQRVRADERVSTEDTIFISVARLESVKAPEVLLEAFVSLSGRYRHAKLWFVGEGSLRTHLKARASAVGLEDKVRFFGSRSDVPALLAAADVFVLPSYYEGNPLSLMEAMAAGKPVIASNVGGIPELMVNDVHGLLVPPANVGALAEAMLVLLDPRLQLRMGAASASRAKQRFESRLMVRAYEQLYERLLTDKCEWFEHHPAMETAVR